MFLGTKNRNEGTGTKNRNEGTCGCSPVPKTGTSVHSPKPPFWQIAKPPFCFLSNFSCVRRVFFASLAKKIFSSHYFAVHASNRIAHSRSHFGLRCSCYFRGRLKNPWKYPPKQACREIERERIKKKERYRERERESRATIRIWIEYSFQGPPKLHSGAAQQINVICPRNAENGDPKIRNRERPGKSGKFMVSETIPQKPLVRGIPGNLVWGPHFGDLGASSGGAEYGQS